MQSTTLGSRIQMDCCLCHGDQGLRLFLLHVSIIIESKQRPLGLVFLRSQLKWLILRQHVHRGCHICPPTSLHCSSSFPFLDWRRKQKQRKGEKMRKGEAVKGTVFSMLPQKVLELWMVTKSNHLFSLNCLLFSMNAYGGLGKKRWAAPTLIFPCISSTSSHF